ncbi:MAG TPA: energy transducer TonB [Pyrinomonadaceae bacterium]|nr:energy transducer TonB [Pyrinomonadaceae bacterium]
MKRQKRMLERMLKVHDQCTKLLAVFLVVLHFFLVEPRAFSQTAIQHIGTDKNWSCLKRKDLLRDKEGRPVWLTSEELMERVLEQEPIERPGPLGRNNLRGVVRIRVLINKHGKVICAQGVDGHPMAIGPAIHAVRKWTFKAFNLDGKRKSVVGVLELPYDFG